MKLLKIIFFFVFSINMIGAVKNLSEIKTLTTIVEEQTHINKKTKTSEYILKFVKPDKIRKEIITPELNKGEIYIYKDKEKVVYLPLFDQVTKEKANSDESDIVNAINYILQLENKDPKLAKEYYEGKLKTLVLENGTKIGIKKLENINGYLLPKELTIYDGNMVIAELNIRKYEVNIPIEEKEFNLND